MVVDVGLAGMLTLKVFVRDVGVAQSGVIVLMCVFTAQMLEAPAIAVVSDMKMAVVVIERRVVVLLEIGLGHDDDLLGMTLEWIEMKGQAGSTPT